MIGRTAVLLGATAATGRPLGPVGSLGRRGARRLLAAPRVTPDEAGLGPALDALGGEVVRLRSRDGLRLSGRWLDADPSTVGAVPPAAVGDPPWRPDPHEAIVVLHGYTGSVAPDLVEYGPFLRRTAGVIGLDMRGHGGSEDGPTTFGLREAEDVAGALAWLGERGITRVVLFGTSMGGITAIAATAILGDGTLAAADMDPDAPAGTSLAPRPRIAGIVAESVAPRLRVAIAGRLRTPARALLADRLLAAVADELGEDPRDVEPIRVLPLLEDLPVLLIHGGSDRTVAPREARRLAGVRGPRIESWVVDGADHSAAHRRDPAAYEARVTWFIRGVLGAVRDSSSGSPEPNVT